MRKLLVASVLLGASLAAAAAGPRPLAARELAARDSRFIEVPGETGEASFRAVAPGKRIAFDASGVEIRLQAATNAKGTQPTLRYSFAGGARVAPKGITRSPTVYHWFVGERSEWATNLRSYRELRYPSVWPGVDAVFGGDAAGVKYQFELAPGTKVDAVALIVDGADDVRVNDAGALEWRIGAQTLVDDAPLAFQSQSTLAASYRVEKIGAKSWRVGFTVAKHDPSRPLIIDPAWNAFSGLVGGNASDQVYAIARDASDNTYACGVTASTNLVTIPPAGTLQGSDDAFVAKFNGAGVPQFVAYVGGAGYDVCTGIAVDGTGRIYLAGGTSSPNFPAVGTDANARLRRTKSGDRDAFVMRFVPNGSSIEYSGFIGGNEDDQANAIAVDAANRAYVTGYTSCTAVTTPGCVTAGNFGFPALVGPSTSHGGGAAGGFGYDAFVARIDAAGNTLEYAGFIGGNGDIEVAYGIAVGADFSAYVVGETNSATGLPAPGGFRTAVNPRPADTSDGFVAKVAPNGASLSYFTLLTGTAPSAGESGADRALAVAIEGDGSVVVSGETDSQNFPANDAGVRTGTGPRTTSGGGMDGFALRLNATGVSVTAATYIGGAGHDSAEGIASDGTGLFVVGTTTSATGFPTVATGGTGLTITAPGAQDGFVARVTLASPTAFAYSGFIGTTANETLHAAAARADGVLAVGGATTTAGSTGITNPNTGALNGTSSAANGLVVKLNPVGPPASITVLAGTPQTAMVNTTFAVALQVAIRDSGGQGVPNVAVTFAAPGAGASATFSPSSTALTNASGIASVMAVANGTAGGPYTVTATGASFVGNFALTNTRIDTNLFWREAAPSVGASWWNMNGATVVGSTYFAVTSDWQVAFVADLNADKKSDIIWRRADGSTYLWLLDDNPLATTFANLGSPGAFWTLTGAGDLDGDGRADIVWRGNDGSVYVWYMNGGAISSQATIGNPGTVWKLVAVADIDGDRKADLVFHNTVNGDVYVWFMNGTAVKGTARAAVLDPAVWTLIRARDFDGDGKADFLWQSTAGETWVWLMDGAAVRGAAPIGNPGAGYSIKAVGDFDADGKADIIWRHTNGTTTFWKMNGTTVTGTAPVFNPGGTWQIVAP